MLRRAWACLGVPGRARACPGVRARVCVLVRGGVVQQAPLVIMCEIESSLANNVSTRSPLQAGPFTSGQAWVKGQGRMEYDRF